MIEFRADCGHAVRAKDHDAGEVVRCTYCGREVQVPLPEEHALDHLLGQNEGSRAGASGKPASPVLEVRQWVGRHGQWVRGGVTLLYLAVVLTVVGYGASWVWQTLSESTAPKVTIVPPRTSPGRDTAGSERTVVAAKARRRSTPGEPTFSSGPAFAELDSRRSGLTIDSVPPRARVYLAAADQVDGSPAGSEENFKGIAPIAFDLSPGRYVVALAMPVTEKSLQRFPGYRALRHELERTVDPRVAEEYLLSDDAELVTLARSARGPLMITRNYEAEVPAGRGAWTAVTGLFLPNLPPTELAALLPEDERYTIDIEQVKGELDFYDVPESEREDALTVLQRVGKLVVQDAKPGAYRVFQVQPSGQIWSAVVAGNDATAPAQPESAPTETEADRVRQILAGETLEEATRRIRELQRAGDPVDPEVWTAFLPGGVRRHVYKSAASAKRAHWIDLIDSEETARVVGPLGELLVAETDSDLVRRAVTEALVRLNDPAATEYINERLRLISSMRGELSLELRAERSRLVRAKNALKE